LDYTLFRQRIILIEQAPRGNLTVAGDLSVILVLNYALTLPGGGVNGKRFA